MLKVLLVLKVLVKRECTIASLHGARQPYPPAFGRRRVTARVLNHHSRSISGQRVRGVERFCRGGISVRRVENDQIEYLPAEDAYFVVGGNGVTRIFDHGAGAWKTVSQDAAQLDLAAGEEAVYLEHDPATASVALSAGGSGPYGGFRIFRYRPPGAFLRPRRAPGTPAWGGMPAAISAWATRNGVQGSSRPGFKTTGTFNA